MTSLRSISRRATLGALPLVLSAPAIVRAQSGLPDRPITMVTASAPGGPTDVLARLIADGMGRDLGQTVVNLNVTGATMSGARAAQAKPDGYTLLINNVGFAATATLYRQLPFNVQESFAPLGLVSEAAMTVVGRRDFPPKGIAELVEHMKHEGAKLNLANSGLGSASHLGGMLLQQAAGASATTIPFRGSAPAMVELIGGRIDIFVDQGTNTVPYLRAGTIKGYAVTSEARVNGLDELPTGLEAGLSSLRMTTWHGLYAPAGTPEPIQQRLAAALRAALREPTLRQRFADLVTAPAPEERATPAFHRRFLAEEIARWRPLIQAAGVYAD
jgi:tripartite-type tricarboxylate transporter receptor subunit TctC